MSSIQECAELAWRQVYPTPNDETSVTLAEFIATAKVEYAYRIWEQNRLERREGGENNIPSNLLSTTELTVEGKKADIRKIKALRSLPNNSWIQLLGGIDCGDCRYVIMDLNKYKLLCDDESRENKKAAIVTGQEIYFPEGIFEKDNKVLLIFANMGDDVDGLTIMEDSVAGLVRRALIDMYGKKFHEDKTNNSNGEI